MQTYGRIDMNIRKSIAIALFLLLFLLSSCKESPAPGEGVQTSPETEAPETEAITEAETEAETFAPLPEVDPDLREPTQNEEALAIIEFQYEKACAARDMAYGLAPGIDTSSPVYDEVGDVYFPVVDNTERPELDGGSINTFSALEKYINSIFDAPIARDLIRTASIRYKDIDGALCRKAEETPPEGDGTEEIVPPEEVIAEIISSDFFLTLFSDHLFRYTEFRHIKNLYYSSIPPESTEKTEYIDYVFENTGDAWLWTVFPLD